MDIIIKADLYRYGGLTFWQVFRTPGFRFSYFYRKAKKYNRLSLPGIWFRLFLHHEIVKYGYQISLSAEIGPGLFLPHFGGIVIGKEVKIGKNCDISPNVVIGRELRGKRKGSPTIGNKVWIGPGAVIVGKIKIGSNVLIAGNSFLNRDVPSNSIVIGNPAKIIKNLKATEGYINNEIS
ncbi:MAG: serine acetyltransferase [Patescibacteria group bacterium]